MHQKGRAVRFVKKNKNRDVQHVMRKTQKVVTGA